MIIKKIIADEKPLFCVDCPLYTLKKRKCGTYKDNVIDGQWRVGGEVPDERCLIQVISIHAPHTRSDIEG